MKALLMLWSQTVYGDDAEFAQVNYTKGRANVDISPFEFNVGGYAVSETLKQLDLSGFKSIVGESTAILRAKKLAAQAARTDFNVLIYGETGTGKELLAEAIWRSSSRKNKGYRAINCAALPPQLLESELLGYKKGSFTGAEHDRDGLFKQLDGGTIFLDEVEACPPEVQAKLLRLLQPPEGAGMTCRNFTPLGAAKEETSDVRIIAATNEKLSGTGFRGDLLNRLATLSITKPCLAWHKGHSSHASLDSAS